MSNEMIERVAKAELKLNNYVNSEPTNDVINKLWDSLNNSAKNRYRNRAKVAIQAMREPTKEMIIVGQEIKNKFPDSLSAQWQAMIDAALKED